MEQSWSSKKSIANHSSDNECAREEGYIYVYVSNENSTLVEVYFDDVTVTQTKSNLIQYNEYYPFGLQTSNSWTRENTTGNDYLYNGGNELNKTTGIYELFYRDYDPVLGRMNQVDPMASKYSNHSPYSYAFNDPVFWNDIYGADPWDDFWDIIDRLWNEVPMDGGGAGWSASGGFTGGYGNLEAFYVGAGYMDATGSWGGGGGAWASSFESAAGAYASATGGPTPLREVTITGSNGQYGGEPYTNSSWLQTRIDEAFGPQELLEPGSFLHVLEPGETLRKNGGLDGGYTVVDTRHYCDGTCNHAAAELIGELTLAAVPLPIPAGKINVLKFFARNGDDLVRASKAVHKGNVTVTRNGKDLFRVHQPATHGNARATVTQFLQNSKGLVNPATGKPFVNAVESPMTQEHIKKLYKALEGIGNYGVRTKGMK